MQGPCHSINGIGGHRVTRLASPSCLMSRELLPASACHLVMVCPDAAPRIWALSCMAAIHRAALVKAGEESVEMGGYFICNGIERIIRMLILQRRHYIMALRRSAYQKRGSNYTDAATLIRSAILRKNS